MVMPTGEHVQQFMAQLRELSEVESPADLLSRVAGLLCSLRGAAVDVYARENLIRSDISELRTVETVFYYFDHWNQSAVAERLGLPVETFMLMLAAYLAGDSAGWCRSREQLEQIGIRL